MKYIVNAAIKTESFSTEHGTFDKYALQLKDESGQEVSCYINQKNTTPAPQVGSELNGLIEPDNRGGMKFKKESAYSGGGSGGGGRYNDPETRKEIIRQSSLAQAVNFCSAKAGFMEMTEAKKYMTGMQVLQVATYFAAYAEGRLHVKMTDQDIVNILRDEGSFEAGESTKAAHEEREESVPAPKAESLPWDEERTMQDIDPDEVPL